MATRSFIALKTADGFEGVYCHWDGYLKHNGAILLEHYCESGKVAELLSHGDMSSLGTSVGQKHDFFAHDQGYTTYYGRDRGENGPHIGIKRYPSLSELVDYAEQCGCEYLYLFDKEWQYAERGPQFFGLGDGSSFSKFKTLQ